MAGRFGGSIRERGPNTYQLRCYLGTDETGKKQYRTETFHGSIREAHRRLDEMAARCRCARECLGRE